MENNVMVPSYGDIIKDFEICIQFDQDEPVVIGVKEIGYKEDDAEVNFVVKNKFGYNIKFRDSKSGKQMVLFTRKVTEKGLELRKSSNEAHRHCLKLSNDIVHK